MSWEEGKAVLCQNRKYKKTSLLEKTPPGAHINKTCAAARGAPSAPGRGCCIKFRMFLNIFLRRSRNARKSHWFLAVSTHQTRSGCRLAAFSGLVPGALWRRSGGVLGSARPCQLPELAFRPRARSHYDCLAPCRPAGAAAISLPGAQLARPAARPPAGRAP